MVAEAPRQSNSSEESRAFTLPNYEWELQILPIHFLLSPELGNEAILSVDGSLYCYSGLISPYLTEITVKQMHSNMLSNARHISQQSAKTETDSMQIRFCDTRHGL